MRIPHVRTRIGCTRRIEMSTHELSAPLPLQKPKQNKNIILRHRTKL